MIRMPISEIVDRYTIALLKNENTEEDLSVEIKVYQDEMRNYKDIEPFVVDLYKINSRIWTLEASLRAGKEEDLPLATIGLRALQIRDINRERIAVKNKIVEKYKEGFKDIKINHASQESKQ